MILTPELKLGLQIIQLILELENTIVEGNWLNTFKRENSFKDLFERIIIRNMQNYSLCLSLSFVPWLPDLLQTHKHTFIYFCYLYGCMKSVLQTCWPNRTSKLFFILLYFFFNIYPENIVQIYRSTSFLGNFVFPGNEIQWEQM